MTVFLHPYRRRLAILVGGAVLLLCGATSAAAQSDERAVRAAASLEIPSVYFFRGLRQEYDPKLTLWPRGQIGVRLVSGDGGLRGLHVGFETWNSLHTGSSGADGAAGETYYEADFSTNVRLALARGLDIGAAFTIYASPNESFRRVKEVSVKAAMSGRIAPYGLLAFEVSGQADGGLNEGTYLELGAEPNWPLAGGRVTLGIPLRLGISVRDYYERLDGHSTFGFFSGGALATVRLSRSGVWTVRGGVDVIGLGETAKTLNKGDTGQVIAVVGIGLAY